MNTPPGIPAAMLDQLNEVRRRDRRVRAQTASLRGLAILLGTMLAAMVIDWVVVLYEPTWRWVLTLSALSCAVAGIAWWGLLPLFRTRSLASIARQVDLAHPALEERYSTLAAASQSQDAPALRGSQSMLAKVAEEAAALSSAVTPDAVVERSGLARAGRYFGIAAGVLFALLALNFSRTSTLCRRFWAPGSNITSTQLRAKFGDVTIGKGERLTLEFVSKGRKDDSAKLFIRPANGREEVIQLSRTGAKDGGFTFIRNAVVDSFQYRARAGDSQTAWQRVTVADRPRLARANLRIVPPAYSRLPIVEEGTLPKKLRALEGSRLEANLRADQPLQSMEIKRSDGQIQSIAEDAEHNFRFAAPLTNTVSFTPDFTNLYHLDNQPKPSCEFVVYKDEPPSIKILSPGDEITARPDDKVKIEFEARDDFGIADAKLLVTVKTETNTSSVVIPIPLDQDTGKKLVHGQVQLDLAKFGLKQDQELSYVVQVTDTKENAASAEPEAAPQKASAATQQASAQQSASTERQSDKQDAGTTTNANSTASAANSSSDARRASPLRQDPQTHLATARRAANSEPRPPFEGSQPPPNDMTKRVLDAGQCSSCQPMRILVDEWGRSFEGQMREKLEIAIDPTLRLLDELLGKAKELTDTTLAAGQSSEGLSQKQNPALDTAKGHLRRSDREITELKSKTQGTPYAFIGLQLHDIRNTHISPARQALGAVTLENERSKDDLAHLEHASFEIQQAREALAALTRNYASVKRDYKLADAMQRLKKMHQIFLEDSQALLGSSKPVLNPKDRKVAEVDDQFVEKLRALLEQKKKIMAELAQILADDPRLLRRFLALQQLEGTSLRDQMTLLARRQQSLAEAAANWTTAGPEARQALLQKRIAEQAAEQADVAAQAAKLQENMVTWLPIEASGDTELLTDCRNLATDASRLAAEAAERTSASTNGAGVEAAHASLEKLRQLDALLPQVEWSQWTGNSKLKLFTANRMSEVSQLITSQSAWIKKLEAIRSGDYPQAAEVDQHRLTVDTTELSEKLDGTALQVRGLSEEIASKAEELNRTVHARILPEQKGAVDALSQGEVKEAASHQSGAVTAFAAAETQFDELLKMIIDKLDQAPPPTEPGRNKTLEELLAMLQDEKKAAESLGIPCRPINVSIQKDWLKAGSGSGQQAGARARAAQEQARMAAERAERLKEQARRLAQQRAAELAEDQRGPKSGPKKPGISWNTLVSQLGEELRQGRESVPPEQYRLAIEQYFNAISDRVPTSVTSTNKNVR